MAAVLIKNIFNKFNTIMVHKIAYDPKVAELGHLCKVSGMNLCKNDSSELMIAGHKVVYGPTVLEYRGYKFGNPAGHIGFALGHFLHAMTAIKCTPDEAVLMIRFMADLLDEASRKIKEGREDELYAHDNAELTAKLAAADASIKALEREKADLAAKCAKLDNPNRQMLEYKISSGIVGTAKFIGFQILHRGKVMRAVEIRQDTLSAGQWAKLLEADCKQFSVTSDAGSVQRSDNLLTVSDFKTTVSMYFEAAESLLRKALVDS